MINNLLYQTIKTSRNNLLKKHAQVRSFSVAFCKLRVDVSYWFIFFSNTKFFLIRARLKRYSKPEPLYFFFEFWFDFRYPRYCCCLLFLVLLLSLVLILQKILSFYYLQSYWLFLAMFFQQGHFCITFQSKSLFQFSDIFQYIS